jgi:hypothetical protein
VQYYVVFTVSFFFVTGSAGMVDDGRRKDNQIFSQLRKEKFPLWKIPFTEEKERQGSKQACFFGIDDVDRILERTESVLRFQEVVELLKIAT